MRTKLGFLAVCSLFAVLITGNAHAVAYEYNYQDVQEFSQLWAVPDGSAVLATDPFSGTGFNSAGEFSIFFNPTLPIGTPVEMGLGVVGDRDFSSYTGVTMDLRNSSINQAIFAALFLTEDNGDGTFNLYHGNVLALNDNEAGTMALDFSSANLLVIANDFSSYTSAGAVALDVANTTFSSYGFSVGTISDASTFIHASAVPEPNTLVLLGSSILVFGGLRRILQVSA